MNASTATTDLHRPIKLSLVIPTLDQSGAEKQLTILATKLDRALFAPEVILLTRSGPYREQLDAAGVPVMEIGKRGKLDPLAYWRLRRHLMLVQPDIVHTWIFAANAYGRLAALRAKVPIIFGGERCVDPWKRNYELAIDRYLAKRTTGILTNSSGIKDFYVSKGIDASKFQIIPNGIEPIAAPKLNRAHALARLGLPTNAFVIGAVGRLWAQKGFKDLIWAAGMLSVVHPHAHLVIFGDGPDRLMLEQFAESTGVAKGVVFAGHRADVGDLIPHLDLYWNGSLYEGQSNAMMEAMQSGVPVIATDIAGNRDLISHEKTGLLYSVGGVDQLLKLTTRLLQEPALRTKLVENAQQKIAQEFSVDAMVQRHQQIYQAAAFSARSLLKS